MVVNKRLRTELYREIRNSLSRFLSILLMVGLGVMFLVGLRSAAPDMRATADRFFDEQGLFDLQVFSTLGLTEGDLDALRALPGVEAAVGGWSLDGTLISGGTERVVKLHSLDPLGFHEPLLTEGRLPSAPDECLLDSRLGGSLKLGSLVSLRCPTEGALGTQRFRVVGFADSPLYLSIDRGTSSLGDGSVAGFVLLGDESFGMEAYSVAYLRAQGAKALDAYGQAWKDRVAALKAAAEPLMEDRAEQRYVFLKADGRRQLAAGRNRLGQAWTQASQALDRGQAELDESRRTLDEGWEALAQGRADYEAGLVQGRAALQAAEAALGAGRAELERAWTQLTAGRAAYAFGQSLFADRPQEAQAQVDRARAALAEREQAAAQAQTAAEQSRREADDYAAALGQRLLDPATEYSMEELNRLLLRAALDEALAEQAQRNLDRGREDLEAALAAQAQVRDQEAQLAQAKAQLDQGQAAYEAGARTLDQSQAALKAGREELARQEVEGAQALEDAEAELKAGEEAYAQGLAELEAGRREAQEAHREAQDQLETARQRLRDLEPGSVYVLDRTSNYGFVSYDQNAQRMANLAKMFPVIFYLVAALVCLTTMTRMVEEERTQIGAIKAMGYGTGAIAAKFLVYGALAALLGTLIGAALGTVVIPWVIFSSYNIMYILPRLELRVYWGLCLGAGGVGLAVTLGAVIWAMGSTARQTPAALLRPKAPKPGKRILLERVGPLWRAMSFSMKVSARNLFRYKKRLFMTVIGVAGCTALLIAGLGLHSSIFDILDVQFFELYRYDVSIAVDTESPGVSQRVAEALEADDSVAQWTGVSSRSVSFSQDGRTAEGYLTVAEDPAAFQALNLLRDMDSKEPLELPQAGCLIDVKLAELLDIGPGEALDTDTGERLALPVAGIREHYVYHYALMSGEAYEGLTGKRPANNEYLIALTEPTEEAASALCKRLMALEGVRSATNKDAMARSFRETMEVVDSAVMIIVLSAAALAFVVLYNLTNINVTERIRELATIKVLGFYDPELAMYIYRENFVLTALGIALGQPLGKLLCAFLIRTIEMDTVMFGRDPKLENYLLSVLLSLVFAFIVNAVMYLRLKRIDMVQALKSVE